MGSPSVVLNRQTPIEAALLGRVRMTPCIAALDAGPAGITFTLYDAATDALRYRGRIEAIGASPRLRVWSGAGELVAELTWRPDALDRRGASREVLRTAADLINDAPVIAIGHRVADGGPDYPGPVRVSPEVLARLAALAPVAPSRQPYNLAALEALAEAAPNIPQTASFDTAFHAVHRRHGAQGLAFESALLRLRLAAPDLAEARLVILHLEREATLCATRGGRSVATADGPTIDLHPVSEDIRTGGASARIVREIGALAAGLGGLDGLVFTGGLGETDPVLRARIAAGCQEVGVALDPARNDRGQDRISAAAARASAWVVAADPQRMVARQAKAVLGVAAAL